MALALALVPVLVGAARPARAAEWQFGAGIALLNNRLAGNPPDEGKYEASFGPGVQLTADVEVATDVQLSFQPGYVVGGASIVYKNAPELDEELEIGYVQLPLLVRVYTEAPRRVRPFVTAGLAAGIPVSAEIRSADGTEDTLDELRDADVRALFGVGLRFPAGAGQLYTELRYTQGLTNLTVAQEDPETPQDPERFKVSSLGLLISWAWAP